MTPSTRNERFEEIDLLRTIAILLMVLYHAAYDLASFCSAPIDPMNGGWMLLERATAILFLLLVGISFAISSEASKRRDASRREQMKKYAKRVAVILSAAAAVSAATYRMDPETYVRFGVLHLIGISAILLPFLMPLQEWNILLAALAFAIGQQFASMSTGTSLLLPLGLHPATFQTVDYFPIFPWISAILLGAAIGNFLYNRGWLRQHLHLHPALRPILVPGRFSLPIYLLHQPILLLILWLAGAMR